MPIFNYGVMTSIDWSKEKGTTRIYAADNGSFDTIVTALNTVQYANTLQATQFTVKDLVTNLPPNTEAAQREEKMLVKYQDNVTLKPYEFTIPCFNKSTVTFKQNSDEIEFDTSAVAPYTNQADEVAIAFETSGQSPDGNPVSVIEIRYVGRNS